MFLASQPSTLNQHIHFSFTMGFVVMTLYSILLFFSDVTNKIILQSKAYYLDKTLHDSCCMCWPILVCCILIVWQCCVLCSNQSFMSQYFSQSLFNLWKVFNRKSKVLLSIKVKFHEYQVEFLQNVLETSLKSSEVRFIR